MSAIVVRTLATLLATTTIAAMPAVAAEKKPAVVIVPASLIANPTARICMPRSTSPLVAKDKTLPDTLCETVDGWATRGVTLRTK